MTTHSYYNNDVVILQKSLKGVQNNVMKKRQFVQHPQASLICVPSNIRCVKLRLRL